jgi:hypothetical protein
MLDSLIQNPRGPQPLPLSATHLTSPYPGSLPSGRMFTEPAQLQPLPRAIQPRPARSTDSPAPSSTNGEGLTIVRTIGPPEFGDLKRKKRGRPTKEEAEERDRILAEQGKVYEPKKRPSKKFRASTGTPVPVGEGPSTFIPHEETPARTIEPKEDSSSGKRRSRRPAGQLSILPPGQPSSPPRRIAGESSKAVESPSDRLLARYSERAIDRATAGPAATSQNTIPETQQLQPSPSAPPPPTGPAT